MNRKILIPMFLLTAVLMMSGMAVNASASETDDTTTGKVSTEKDQCPCKGDKEHAQFQEMIKKWDKLTDTQKEKVYQILEEKMKVEQKLLDQYVSLGIMDKTKVETIKKDMTAGFKKMKESGEMPMKGMRPHRGEKLEREKQ